MLVDFSVKNFGPFREKTTITMQKTSLDGLDNNLLPCQAINEELLSSAVIFGPNSSGKSYVIRAIEVLRNMIKSPMNPDIEYPWYTPFRLSTATVDAPVEMNVRFTEKNTLFDYHIGFKRNCVVDEHLYYYPSKKRTMVFERKYQSIQYGRTVMKGMTAIGKMTSPTSSFLAVAAQLNNDVCIKAHRGILQNMIVIGSNPSALLGPVINRMNDDSKTKNRIIRAMRIADFGIKNIEGNITKKKISELGNELPPKIIGLMMMTGSTELNNVQLYMEHDFPNADVDQNLKKFPYVIESNGTMQAFCLMGPLVDALERGCTIFVDEFGAFFHSDISRWILTQFRKTSNPNNAQIIVNTHDQMLMDLNLLRRDQIMFTQKDPKNGESELYALSDFNGVRNNIDVRKNYSIGRYEAQPFIAMEDVMDEQ